MTNLLAPALASAEERGFSPRFDTFKSAVQLRESRDPEAISAAAAGEPPPGIVIAPDVRLVSEGFLGFGYDSNIDHLVANPQRGGNAIAELGSAFVIGPRDAETTAVARGSFGYHDIEVRPERWDFGALVDHHRAVTREVGLNIGAFYLRDDIDTDPNQRIGGYMEWAYKSAVADAFSRTRGLRTDYFGLLNETLGNRLFSRDRRFDNDQFEQSFGVLLLKDRLLAPFFQVGYGSYTYFHQDNPAVFNRNADELWAITGVRVNLDPTLHVDLGARYNERWLRDPNLDSHGGVFFDGKLVWTPRAGTYFEIDAERFFNEPISETSLFTESTVYSATLVHYLDTLTRVKAEVGYIREEQIGAPEVFRHIYGQLELTRRIDRHLEIYGSFIAYNTVEQTTDREADRYNVLVGARISN